MMSRNLNVTMLFTGAIYIRQKSVCTVYREDASESVVACKEEPRGVYNTLMLSYRVSQCICRVARL